MAGLLSSLTTLPMMLAGIGLILATSSFISGLQLVRAASIVEGKIHRFNGVTNIILYIVLAVMSFTENGVRFWPFLAWISGLSIIATKIYIVRTRKRAFKYVSWVGGTLILIWLFLVYIHLPV